MSALLLAVPVLLLLAAGGLLLALALRIRATAELLLAAYVIAFAEVIVLVLFLSLFESLTRGALVVGSAAVLVAALGTWLLAGTPHPPRPSRSGFGSLRGSAPLAALTAIVALTLAYAVVLIAGTPPNGWDQLSYHLARAALWLESGNVGYVDHAYDSRLNSYPPNGEIGLAFGLEVTRDEVSAAAVQLAAALACAVGVFVLARRRLGLSRREGAFGALLFLALPIVLLQATSTKNDIVVASFLVAAAVFVLGDSRQEIGLASLATALAVGTKFTAFYGVLVILALALLAAPRAARGLRALGVAVGATAGLYWYAVNAVETGEPLGDTSSFPGLTAPLSPRENLLEAVGLAVDWIDLSGAQGRDILLYLGAALVVATGVVLFQRGPTRGRVRSAAVAAGLAASPLVLYLLVTRVGRPGLLELYDGLGQPTAYIPAEGDPFSSHAVASDTASWFGPVGLLLATGVGVAALVLVRRGSLPRFAAVCALAPLAWTVLVALSLTYHPWQGRFFLFPVALSASLWGLTLRAPAAAWGMTALTAVTASLSFVHYLEKPSGLKLLERTATSASVWTMERWEAQSGHAPEMAPVFRFLDEEVPRQAPLALALGANDFGYPAFGPHLERRIELVPFGSNAAETTSDWLFASPDRVPEIDVACWSPVHSSEGGNVFRRQAQACES